MIFSKRYFRENSSKLAEQLAKKDEEFKKLTSYGQLQQSRAQEGEVRFNKFPFSDIGARSFPQL